MGNAVQLQRVARRKLPVGNDWLVVVYPDGDVLVAACTDVALRQGLAAARREFGPLEQPERLAHAF